MTDKSLSILKKEARELGLTPYASLYGDRRERATWERLLESVGELPPLQQRQRDELPVHAQINWKLAIAFLALALGLIFLLQPRSIFPIKITIQIGANHGNDDTFIRR